MSHEGRSYFQYFVCVEFGKPFVFTDVDRVKTGLIVLEI